MADKGNAGVAKAVKQVQGAIRHVEYTYAEQNDLIFAQVQNAHGLFVSPNTDAFQPTASTADWKYFKDFSVTIGDAAGGADAL